MPEIIKAKIKSINKLEKFNDLFKFEVKFENGKEGLMYKKTEDPMCSVGDDVMFTLSSKGTIKIIKEGQEQFVNKPFSKSNDDLIMIQCMFKASAMYHSKRSASNDQSVIETAKQWFEASKEILENKNPIEAKPVFDENPF